MLCELAVWGNIWITWSALSILGLSFILLFSGSVFWRYYWAPTYEQWVHKTNPVYPSPEKVRDEVLQTLKGLVTATFCPSLALFLAQRGVSQGYCGVGDHGWGYLAATFVMSWIFIDFFEFFYHHLGHTHAAFWAQHKAHHVFFNPSPFAVIADDFVDQFVRSSPLLFLPMIVPINIDMLFFMFGLLFYGYGTFLHWGYESTVLDAHNPVCNTAYQHYYHHAQSHMNKAMYTGFFFKIWDQLFGTVSSLPCVCAKCEASRGNRSKELWAKVPKPDYSPLLKMSFWMEAFSTNAATVKTA